MAAEAMIETILPTLSPLIAWLEGGGPSRNRTGVQGFAVLCVTTPPSGLGGGAGLSRAWLGRQVRPFALRARGPSCLDKRSFISSRMKSIGSAGGTDAPLPAGASPFERGFQRDARTPPGAEQIPVPRGKRPRRRRSGNVGAARGAELSPRSHEQRWLRLADLPLDPFVDIRHEGDGTYPAPRGHARTLLDATLEATDLVFVVPVYWYGLPALGEALSRSLERVDARAGRGFQSANGGKAAVGDHHRQRRDPRQRRTLARMPPADQPNI